MKKGPQAIAALLLAAAGTGCVSRLPDYRPPESVTHLDQNWRPDQRAWFYHTSQGTKVMPYRWFLALEQPKLRPFGSAPRFAAPEHLARFGFIPDAPSPQNPDGLPVGFARDEFGVREGTDQPETVVGLTCAACHTGQIEYGRRAVRIDGGPAMTDTAAFQEHIGRALLLTYVSGPRFERFAGRVLGMPDEPDTPEARARLKQRLAFALDAGLTEQGQARRRELYPVEEGFGRLDALGRGGNYVFGTRPQLHQNLAVADGPVSYPGLWDAPWFDWVQYNGAIRQPMGRNVAEAMGVRSLVKLLGTPEALYRSSVRIENIHDMEQLLAGARPGEGLRSPRWPEEIFGPIDRAAAERGRAHYQRLCAGCHEGTWSAADAAPGARGPAEPERRYLRVTMVPLDEIGTDPKAALNFARRTAELPGVGRISAAEGLRRETTAVIDSWYRLNSVPDRGTWVDANGVRRPGRDGMNGHRENEWRAPEAYRARPLNGIWATAPYLHNGSVPSLYQLLLPAERRDKAFYTGSRQFDPLNVGFAITAFEGGFRFDTSIPGNWNRGHEFRDAPRGQGVIGPELTDRQRRDIVEYLKTL
jgi:cytochrome c5